MMASTSSFNAAPGDAQPANFRRSDLRAAAALGIEAARGITSLVEGVHQAVHSQLGLGSGDASQRTRGLSGAIYRTIHGVMAGVGGGLELIFRLIGEGRPEVVESTPRLAWLGVINGVIGDHLHATSNALALPMSLHPAKREAGESGRPVAGKRIALFIHGLCMSDQHWRASAPEMVDYGVALQNLGYTPLYLRYNTGLRIATNGRQLAQLIQSFLDEQDESVDEICLIGHSMGGLIARSAVHYAGQQAFDWAGSLKHMVFLGTPHHGSRLEQAGSLIDQLLTISRFSAPFTRLGGIRSAGIRDLRHGNLIDPGLQASDQQAGPMPVPLPAGVRTLAIAATTGKARSALSDHLSGDGLVPVSSALGEHSDRSLSLNFDDRQVLTDTGHLELLHSPQVLDVLQRWLAKQGPSALVRRMGAPPSRRQSLTEDDDTAA